MGKKLFCDICGVDLENIDYSIRINYLSEDKAREIEVCTRCKNELEMKIQALQKFYKVRNEEMEENETE
jgi:hypothetical protein